MFRSVKRIEDYEEPVSRELPLDEPVLRDEWDPDPLVEQAVQRLRDSLGGLAAVDEWGRPMAWRHIVRSALGPVLGELRDAQSSLLITETLRTDQDDLLEEHEALLIKHEALLVEHLALREELERLRAERASHVSIELPHQPMTVSEDEPLYEAAQALRPYLRAVDDADAADVHDAADDSDAVGWA